MKKVDIIVDLQYGSTGKGLIAGFLAKTGGYDTVINANMPNAGHTFIDSSGREWIHKVLPNGIVSESIKLVGLGAGSVFDVDRLAQEYDDSIDLMETKKLIIHESAVVLQAEHREIERKMLNGISSTMQGSAAAMIQKIMRSEEANPLAKHALRGTRWEECLVTNSEWMRHMQAASSILLEGAQGYSLGINAGFWPYCTSRDCTPVRFMSDCSIPHDWVRDVIGTARMHPIRVGNTANGYSGGYYPDQREMSWEELGQDPEKTTVTQRVRRVFSFSEQQMVDAISACRPNKVFLNFCNYDEDMVDSVIRSIHSAMSINGVQGRVAYTGWGPAENGVVRVQ